ncbi:MAG TPA: UMP kinase [Candidatus Eisenbacteria bacterium]|nr:UMP kinase [Candidatus Eisenbacteria bacterium]
MRLVLRLGGSVVASPFNPSLLRKYVELLNALSKEGHRSAVVVGGGALAREFIKIAKDLDLPEPVQDDVAISVSRLYARLFVEMLEEAGCKKVSLTIEDAAECFARGKIAVMGGLKPGMTTDTVAALIAEEIDADLYVKATDQDGVYNKDPRKHADAVKLERLSFDDLPRVLAEDKHSAGIHQVLDPEAIKLLKKRRVKVIVVNGDKPNSVKAAVNGEKAGTIIE